MEFKLTDYIKRETRGYTTDDAQDQAGEIICTAFMKCTELIEAFIESKGQTTIYAQEILDFIEGLK